MTYSFVKGYNLHVLIFPRFKSSGGVSRGWGERRAAAQCRAYSREPRAEPGPRGVPDLGGSLQTFPTSRYYNNNRNQHEKYTETHNVLYLAFLTSQMMPPRSSLPYCSCAGHSRITGSSRVWPLQYPSLLRHIYVLFPSPARSAVTAWWPSARKPFVLVLCFKASILLNKHNNETVPSKHTLSPRFWVV